MPLAEGFLEMHAETPASHEATPSANEGSAPRLPTLDEIERSVIEYRLQHFGGNKTQAAQSLGISLKTIYNRLNAYRKADSKRGARS